MKQIITISGTPGSGKSTVAKNLVDYFQAERIYVGGIRRELAKQKGMSLDQLNEYAETHPETDVDVDKKTAQNARQQAENKMVVVEGRTQFHFLPESYKIYIKVDLKEAARRIWNDLQKEELKKQRNEGKISSEQECYEDIIKRIESDKKRYKKYYNLDHTDESHYDLVIDSTNIPADQVTQIIINKLKELDEIK